MSKFTVALIIHTVFLFMFLHSIESFRVEITIEPAEATNTQTRFSYNGIENFDSRTTGDFQSDFGTNGVLNGNYSSGVEIRVAGAVGGANRRGKYLKTGDYCDLLISNQRDNGVNYFGLLITAAVATDQIQFFTDFSNESMIFDWNASSLIEILKSGKSNKYKDYFGNPWMDRAAADYPYVFVNFYFYDVTIHKVKIGYHTFTDNHVIGWFTGQSGEVPELQVTSSTSSTSPTSPTSPDSSASSNSSTSSTSPTSSDSSASSNSSTSSISPTSPDSSGSTNSSTSTDSSALSNSSTSSISPTLSNSSTSSTSSTPSISSKQLTSSTSSISSKPSTRLNSTRKNQSGVSIGIIMGFLIVKIFYYIL